MDDWPNFHRVTLEIHKIMNATVMDPRELGSLPNAQLQSQIDDATKRLVLSISAFFVRGGVRVTREAGVVSVPFPATWWQHFKQSHFPQWLLGRYPVRTVEARVETLTLKAFHACPHLAVDPLQRHYEFLMQEPELPEKP